MLMKIYFPLANFLLKFLLISNKSLKMKTKIIIKSKRKNIQLNKEISKSAYLRKNLNDVK